MAKKIALGVGAVIALLVVVILVQPASFAVERSVSIAAPPAAVYPHIASVRAMDVWSPWSKMDPQMKTDYEGPESGVGSRSVWAGPQMGQGSVTVTAVKPDREVEMRLQMLAPMAVDNRVLFTLDPSASATDVTWRMEGRSGFVGKAMSLVMDSDRMVGGEFEKGLAALKTLVETEAQPRAVE
jgi:Polyketide cyclase / dehydrase and lipid transport